MDISFIILLAILLIIVVLAILYNKGRTALLKEKKEKYLNAIRSRDKAKALIAGRDYYACLRKGTLTIYDEQAIANDLSVM